MCLLIPPWLPRIFSEQWSWRRVIGLFCSYQSERPSCSLVVFLGVTTTVTTFGGSSRLFSFAFPFVILIVVLFLLGLDQCPLFLGLDGIFKGAFPVASSVVANDVVPPELVGQEGASDGVRVVDLVVVADPWADQSPGHLPGGISTKTRDLRGFTAWIKHNKTDVKDQFRLDDRRVREIDTYTSLAPDFVSDPQEKNLMVSFTYQG